MVDLCLLDLDVSAIRKPMIQSASKMKVIEEQQKIKQYGNGNDQSD
jgi:hypothetical protein